MTQLNRRRIIDRAWSVAQHQVAQEPNTQQSKEDTSMARKRKNTQPPATAAEVRAHFADNPNDLPDGLEIGTRGRLSADVKEAFTAATGRTVA